MTYELWTGTPNEMELVKEDQAPGPIRNRAKDELGAIHFRIAKFDHEAAKPVKRAIEEVKKLQIADIVAGKPFHRTFPYLGVNYVLEIRQVPTLRKRAR